MPFSEFFSPLKRNQILFFLIFIITTIATFLVFEVLPKTQKTTIYFSIKPLKTENENQATSLDPVESAMKITDMISGWAKNPAFRKAILKEANVSIPHFKRKITARKQNRTNIFWTITLHDEEIEYNEKIIQATISVFKKNFEEFNNQNLFPFENTTPQIFKEFKIIPQNWILLISFFVGIFISFLFIYSLESIKGITSFAFQIKQIFPKSPILKISEKIGKHDEKLLKQFISTFPSPQLIGTFPEAESIFSLASQEDLNEIDTPILLINLGKTKHQELENLKAILGNKIGIIIFDA